MIDIRIMSCKLMSCQHYLMRNKMNQIQKVSSYLLIVFKCLMIGIPLFFCIEWYFLETGLFRELITLGILNEVVPSPEGHMKLTDIHWTFLTKTLGFTSQMVGFLPYLLGLASLTIIFQNYKRGEIFSVQNAMKFRFLGLLFFVNGFITQPLSILLMTLAVTLSNPPGHRYISLTFGTLNLESLFCGAIVLVISWVMLEASKLYSEQKFTI